VSAADILTAARANPLSPIVPAREEWLKDWTGPVLWLDTFRTREGKWVASAYGPGGMANGAPAERIRLDLRRPEVRDRLVRCGAPPIVRDSVAAALTWVLTGRDIMAGLRDCPEEVLTPRHDGWYIPLPNGAVGWLPREA